MPENIWNSICAIGEPEMRYHGTARMFIPWNPGMVRSKFPAANASMNLWKKKWSSCGNGVAARNATTVTSVRSAM